MKLKRRAQLILSIAFLLSSLAVFNQVDTYFRPPAPAASVPTCPAMLLETSPCQALPIEGLWEQYSIVDGQRQFMARLELRADGASDYLAIPLQLAPDCGPNHDYRSYAHRQSDGVWTFREDWDGEIGEFVLTQQSNGEWVGTATHLSCGDSFQTVFVRAE